MLTIQSQQEAYEILANELKMTKARAEEALDKLLEEKNVKRIPFAYPLTIEYCARCGLIIEPPSKHKQNRKRKTHHKHKAGPKSLSEAERRARPRLQSFVLLFKRV
jgi:hypothetical protein